VVVDLVLGGGEGLLMSMHGAGCDNLLSATIVLPDGRQVKASADSSPDLFWAIRGGGGNVGVANREERLCRYQYYKNRDSDVNS